MVSSCSAGARTWTDSAGTLSGPRASRSSCRIRISLCIRIPCDCKTTASPLRWCRPRSWSAIKSEIEHYRGKRIQMAPRATRIINVAKGAGSRCALPPPPPTPRPWLEFFFLSRPLFLHRYLSTAAITRGMRVTRKRHASKYHGKSLTGRAAAARNVTL